MMGMDKIEIAAGLQGGETIVIEGNYALPDGTKIEIAKDQEKKEGRAHCNGDIRVLEARQRQHCASS